MPAPAAQVAADAVPPRESEGVSLSEQKPKKLISTFLSGLRAGDDRDDKEEEEEEEEEEEQPISRGGGSGGRASRAVPFAPYCPSKVTPRPQSDTGSIGTSSFLLGSGAVPDGVGSSCRRAPPQLRAHCH
jgi:hypothetical protein